MNPLSADLGLRFLAPRATCAVCGKYVDPDQATVIAVTDEPDVRSAVAGLHLLVDVSIGESLVICADCRAAE